MLYRQNKTFWYQFCNFKHFLEAENSEDSLASSWHSKPMVALPKHSAVGGALRAIQKMWPHFPDWWETSAERVNTEAPRNKQWFKIKVK